MIWPRRSTASNRSVGLRFIPDECGDQLIAGRQQHLSGSEESFRPRGIALKMHQQSEQEQRRGILGRLQGSLSEKFLMEEPLTKEEIYTGLRKATITGKLVPVLCGTAFKNKGVQPLLDAVVDFLPSPIDREAIKGVDVDSGEELLRNPSDAEPFSMLAFKIMDDPFVGTITFCRIYSGKVEAGTTVLNSTKDKKERIGRMLLMHANNREDIKEAYAGDIVALAGLKEVRTGDTLCDMGKPVILERMEFPEPVIEIAIEPKSKADEERLSMALGRMSEEDPTFRVRTNEETGQTLIDLRNCTASLFILSRLFARIPNNVC